MGIFVTPSPDSDDGERATFFKPGEVIKYDPTIHKNLFVAENMPNRTARETGTEYTLAEPLVWAKAVDSFGEPHFRLIQRGWPEPVSTE